MTGKDFSDPPWKLEMASKDTGLFLMGAEWEGVTLHAIPGIASLMDEWIEKGHGKEDWTIIGSGK
jgi:3-hydroxyisobutyrate dehydrogenase